MNAPSLRRARALGWGMLAVSLPLGLTLEALHALKVDAYLGSELRRELWRLAHAHGGFFGILLLVFAGIAERWLPAESSPSIARWLSAGSVMLPLGFFLGGIMNREGDPSLGILLVPIGSVCLLVALVRAAWVTR